MSEPLSPIRVLVVDDDEAIQLLMDAIFRGHQVVVKHVFNGKHALEILRRERYDAVVLDLMLPDMNGFEVIRTLKHFAPQMLQRTVVLTAASERVLHDFDDARAVRCVMRKPFDINALIEQVMACGPVAPSDQRLKIRALNSSASPC